MTSPGREQPQLNRLRKRPGWEQGLEAVTAVRGLNWAGLQTRRGDWGRDLAWYLGRREYAMSLKALGEVSGRVDYATVSAGAKRIARRLNTDKMRASKVHQILQRIEQI